MTSSHSRSYMSIRVHSLHPAPSDRHVLHGEGEAHLARLGIPQAHVVASLLSCATQWNSLPNDDG